MDQIKTAPEDLIHARDVGFYFVSKADFPSVARYGVLSRHLLLRLGQRRGDHIYKAQRQIGIDLISIYDPWAFLRRHWRNRALGSENRPRDIMDFDSEAHFENGEELSMVEAIRDTDPPMRPWVGISACKCPRSRRKLDRVRRRIASLVMQAGPAPGLEEDHIHTWIDQELADTSYDGDLAELCLLLSPKLPRYDFPGYKMFENFVRFRIPPRHIVGVVTNTFGAEDRCSMQTASARDYRVYLMDGTEVSRQ